MVNVPIVTLFFFLPFPFPFIDGPFNPLGIVAVAATIGVALWEIESVGGEEDEELPSMSPFVLLP